MSENCDHNHADDAPMRFAERGNLYLGLTGVAVGLFTGSNAALADGIHNVADSRAHKAHRDTAEAERHDLGAKNVTKARKRAGVLIGAGALLVGGYSAYEIAQGSPDSSLNVPAVAIEAGSIALNGVVAYKFSKQQKTLQGQTHSHRHNLVDLATSSVAMVGILANPVLPHADSAAGIFVSVVTGSLGVQIYKGKAH